MRNIAFVAAIALVTVLFIAVLFAVRTPQESTALASAAATGTRVPSATSTAEIATPRISLSPTPPPTPSGTYVDQTYNFSVVLPEPYRKSTRLSLTNTGRQDPAAVDSFTPRTEADEAPLAGKSCDTTCPIRNYVAFVEISTGVTQTPRQWYTSRASAAGQRIDDVIVDGRPAIRVTNGAEMYVPVQLIVKDGDRMFRIGYQITPDPVPLGASKDKLEQILASFKFLP